MFEKYGKPVDFDNDASFQNPEITPLIYTHRRKEFDAKYTKHFELDFI